MLPVHPGPEFVDLCRLGRTKIIENLAAVFAIVVGYLTLGILCNGGQSTDQLIIGEVVGMLVAVCHVKALIHPLIHAELLQEWIDVLPEGRLCLGWNVEAIEGIDR